MANQPRARKRVHAIRRAPDGSAFQKCEYCGASVAIAVSDMHECDSKRDVKRIKLESGNRNITKTSFEDQPRSPFRFFMESFKKTCEDENSTEIDRKGVETWTNMSKEERLPCVLEAQKVNSAYKKTLLRESEDIIWVDEEADSAEVGKYDERYIYDEYYEDSESSDEFESFCSESFEIFNTNKWQTGHPRRL